MCDAQYIQSKQSRQNFRNIVVKITIKIPKHTYSSEISIKARVRILPPPPAYAGTEIPNARTGGERQKQRLNEVKFVTNGIFFMTFRMQRKRKSFLRTKPIKLNQPNSNKHKYAFPPTVKLYCFSGSYFFFLCSEAHSERLKGNQLETKIVGKYFGGYENSLPQIQMLREYLIDRCKLFHTLSILSEIALFNYKCEYHTGIFELHWKNDCQWRVQLHCQLTYGWNGIQLNWY